MSDLAKGWLPIVLCPTDGVDRMLLLPDGREVVGAHHNGGIGQARGWTIATPMEVERPVYEYPLRGGFIMEPHLHRSQPEPEPERKQTGTRKETIWLMGRLPDGVYPTHFRPNDTVYGDARTPLPTAAAEWIQKNETVPALPADTPFAANLPQRACRPPSAGE